LLHELPDFEFFEPSTLEDAVKILHQHRGKARLLGGGTDLLGLMKDRIQGQLMPIPEKLVSVKKIRELRSISHTGSYSVVGAAATLSEISADRELSDRFPAFVQGSGSVGTNQIRNMGTLGGNLCQRPWCWYFRHPAYDCFKKGGKQCFAITGENSTYFSIYDLGVCVMAHPSDTGPALISLDARAEIIGPLGTRSVPMKDFFLGPREPRDNVVGDDEVLARVKIPNAGKKSVYIKQRVRNNWDFALASVAASAFVDEGRLSSVTLVLGGVAPRPQLLAGMDDLVAGGVTNTTKARLGAMLSENARPLRLNRYKLRMVNGLAFRALASLAAPAAA
jgi:xanthine dehydrogenase YagS FAD-binding subunit